LTTAGAPRGGGYVGRVGLCRGSGRSEGSIACGSRGTALANGRRAARRPAMAADPRSGFYFAAAGPTNAVNANSTSAGFNFVNRFGLPSRIAS
jgi:hypothetical protein